MSASIALPALQNARWKRFTSTVPFQASLRTALNSMRAKAAGSKRAGWLPSRKRKSRSQRPNRARQSWGIKPLLLLLAFMPLAACGASLTAPLIHLGMCDASAAVALSSDHFAVADDEDNPIRVYRADEGNLPTQT